MTSGTISVGDVARGGEVVVGLAGVSAGTSAGTLADALTGDCDIIR